MAARERAVFHPQVYVDLSEIWNYIASDSPEFADRVLQEILTAIDSLVSFPNQGHVRADLTARPMRFQVVTEYLIAYVPERPVHVLAVVHGKRSPRTLATLLRDRR